MGTQQLLIAILGIILVGLAVALGIGIFGTSSQEANTDAVVADCMRLAAGAQQWYTKPTCLGGGGNSFAGLTLSRAGFAHDSDENGSFSITHASNGSVQIVGTGNEHVLVNITVFPDSVSNPVITKI